MLFLNVQNHGLHKMLLWFTLIIINQHIRMISEGSCDAEDTEIHFSYNITIEAFWWLSVRNTPHICRHMEKT